MADTPWSDITEDALAFCAFPDPHIDHYTPIKGPKYGHKCTAIGGHRSESIQTFLDEKAAADS
jgi:hypothetical protein